MDPCVSLLTRLFLIAVIWGLHVGGVAINRGNEIVKYKSCPEDTKPVFVDLKCPFQFSTASSSQLITTKWTDITHYPSQTTVVNINNNGTLLPGDAYLNANITRLSTDRLDGSIRLELQNTPIGDLRTIECEVYVFGDSPNLDTSTTTVINTGVIRVPEKLGPGLSIALSLIALVMAVFNIYMVKTKPKLLSGGSKGVALMLSAIGVVLCIPAIVLSVLYITQEPAFDLPYKDYDIAGGVCSCVELVCVLSALIITVVGIQDFGNHSGGGSLEMGNGRPEPRDSPKRPPSDISRKDVNVDMKQRGGQGRGSPRKNSVEPVEKKAKVAAMAVSAPAPRKLPPMPQVDVNSQVRAMKKKKKRKKNLPENVE